MRTGLTRGLGAGLAGLVAVAIVATAVAAPSSESELELSSELRLRAERGRDLVLEVRASARDTYETIAERVTGDRNLGTALAAQSGAGLTAGSWVRVPFALVDSDHRRLALSNLFPQDRRDGEDWIHVARSGRLPLYDAGWWQIAEWFTARGENFAEIERENGATGAEPAVGQAVRVPARLLHPAFREGPRSDDGSLEFAADPQGPFAAYRLRAGEALYSAVVIRFTGRTRAGDVAAVAQQIATRSGVRDVTDIPVGYRIKIDLDLLETEFLPSGHPRRVAAEAERLELAREMARRPAPSRSRRLDGVVVILDPGHGGRDLGTTNNGIWEHDYVYDVACRVKTWLERETAATVHLTLLDRDTGCVPSAAEPLRANRQGTILTDPPFLAREDGEARIGVNLRWYLANSLLRRAVRAGTDPERVVFVSLHADARHPSLSGVMVYVPGANHAGRTHGFESKTYQQYAEVREQPLVRFSRQQLVRSEALSGELARAMIQAFRNEGLPVQPYQPVRSRIIRGRSVFVPAVLRGNEVPTKVLVEMVNLSHRGDAALLASAPGRERMASALCRGLLTRFGASSEAS